MLYMSTTLSLYAFLFAREKLLHESQHLKNGVNKRDLSVLTACSRQVQPPCAGCLDVACRLPGP